MNTSNIRFGLCCIFRKENIKFRSLTAQSIISLPRNQQLKKLSEICLHNCQSLLKAVKYCNSHGIKAFRILSPLFPRYTHPQIGYYIEKLPDFEEITTILSTVRTFCHSHDIRLSFHPDQFVVINSPNEVIQKKSLEELEYQGLLAEWVGADVINIHAGGHYGDKNKSLERFLRAIDLLSEKVRTRLSIENDDICYTVSDLLPISKRSYLPVVYDVHHHRCNPDNLSILEATLECMETWKRIKKEPYFHISSPKNGWGNGDPKPHHDYIDFSDFPKEWLNLKSFTLDIEAKAKELSIQKLWDDLNSYLRKHNKMV